MTSTDTPILLQGAANASHDFGSVTGHHGKAATIDLKPSFVSMELPRSAFSAEVQGITGKKIFDAAVGGGTAFPGIVWLFTGEDYLRLDLRTGQLTGPATIAGNWGSGKWPPTFASGIDAAITFTNEPAFAWFFKGSEYIRYNLTTDTFDGPASIVPNWHGVPDEFGVGLDACATGRGPFEGMSWMFKGSDYLRFNDLTNAVDIGPSPITAGWHGWPDSFSRVDCAISGVGSESDILYLLQGDEFIAYDLTADAVSSSPKPIASKWPALAPFMRRPQLFLVESLTVESYYGEMRAGALLTSTSLGPQEETSYSVLVKRSVTTTSSETTTVLESEDHALIDEVNNSMRDEAAKSKSNDAYSYTFDSSFEGDLSYTGLGGSVDATLNFQGSSNEARDAASQAAMKAVQTQVSRTDQSRRDSTSVVSGTQASTDQVETTHTQSIKNPTDKPVSLGFFQIIQDYIALTVLKDVRIAFANGGQTDISSCERLDQLLAKYIADPGQTAAIKSAIVAELMATTDYTKTNANCFRPTDGGIAFSPQQASSSNFTPHDSLGDPLDPIEVEGVIVHTHLFSELLPATKLEEL